MTRATWVVLAIASAAGCTKGRRIDVHATELHVNGLVAPIPDGWRDAHELRGGAPEMPVAGMRALILDRFDVVGEIDVAPMPVPISGDRCAEVAKKWQAVGGAGAVISGAEGATFDGDAGCIMKIQVQDLVGKIAVRTHDGHTVVVRAIHRPQPAAKDFNVDTEVESGFDKVLYGLRTSTPEQAQ